MPKPGRGDNALAIFGKVRRWNEVMMHINQADVGTIGVCAKAVSRPVGGHAK